MILLWILIYWEFEHTSIDQNYRHNPSFIHFGREEYHGIWRILGCPNTYLIEDDVFWKLDARGTPCCLDPTILVVQIVKWNKLNTTSTSRSSMLPHGCRPEPLSSSILEHQRKENHHQDAKSTCIDKGRRDRRIIRYGHWARRYIIAVLVVNSGRTHLLARPCPW